MLPASEHCVINNVTMRDAKIQFCMKIFFMN